MKELTVRVKGIAPCIMHNGQMADPLNKYAKAMKEISGKRKKSDEDHADMARIEFEAALYTDKDGYPAWPGVNIERMMIDAAKKVKLGTMFKSAIMVDGMYRLEQPLGKSVDVLFEKARLTVPVKVSQATVMRTRPVFHDWACEFKILYNEELVNQRDLEQVLDIAGTQIGLSTWRPRYGRFVVESVK